jgi:hypothetical protein
MGSYFGGISQVRAIKRMELTTQCFGIEYDDGDAGEDANRDRFSPVHRNGNAIRGNRQLQQQELLF